MEVEGKECSGLNCQDRFGRLQPSKLGNSHSLSRTELEAASESQPERLRCASTVFFLYIDS